MGFLTSGRGNNPRYDHERRGYAAQTEQGGEAETGEVTVRRHREGYRQYAAKRSVEYDDLERQYLDKPPKDAALLYSDFVRPKSRCRAWRSCCGAAAETAMLAQSKELSDSKAVRQSSRCSEGIAGAEEETILPSC